MKTTRRSIMAGGLAVAATAAVPGIGKAQTKPPASRTIRAVLHGDIPTYDPIWTTANMSAYHGGMVYDTLFGVDEQDVPHPQMVDKYGVSDDKKTWTFELRDGLKWHDGTDVTTADIVPSIRRWAARDGAGQLMMQRTKDISAKDAKTFSIVLNEPFGLLPYALGKTVTPGGFMMRKREAETDPMQKIDKVVGSGPFVFNEGETRPGNQYVYDKNMAYVPRKEPPSGIAGGKIVKVDRVIYMNMPDAQTAVSAVQAGEIDFYETPPVDMLDQFKDDPDVVVETLNNLGNVGWIRLNFLYPPFDNVKVRQAMLYLSKQSDMLRPTFGDGKNWRECGSFFACGSAMENDANEGWFKGGQNVEKAKALLKEGGYNGEEIVLLQATNIAYMMNAATVLAQQMRKAGMKVRVEPMDWSQVVQRRASKAKPSEGGWNIFITSAGGGGMGNPFTNSGMGANGEKGWFGWPSNAKHEQLRQAWINADTVPERKKIATEIQANAWDFVPHIYFGQWVQPTIHRKNVTGWLHVAEIIPFWNVQKT